MSSSSAAHEANSSSPSSSRNPISNPSVSGRPTRRRPKAAKIAGPGPDSSPPAPTRSGLTPEKPQVRRSSIQFPTQVECRNVSVSNSPLQAEELEGMDFEMDTPTKKRTRRPKSNPSEHARLPALSPLRQMTAPEKDVVSVEGSASSRPTLPMAHTSPELHDETERRNERPHVTARSASNPATPQKRLSGTQLDREIMTLIMDGPKTPKDKKTGFLYFYTVKPQDYDVQLFKIGVTKRPLRRRSKEIQAKCKHDALVEHTEATARSIPFNGFAEKLIHQELDNFRDDSRCICGTQHREYFNVNEDVALEVFHRWRAFCVERPWTADGKLLPLWEERLDNRPLFSDTKMDFDHRELARHWRFYTQPMVIERYGYDAVRLWKEAFPHRWSIAAMAELLTMVYLSPFSFLVKTWLFIIMILSLMDLIPMEDKYATKVISQLPSGGLRRLMLPETPIKSESKAATPQTISNQSVQQKTQTPNSESMGSRKSIRNDEDCLDEGDALSDGDDITSPGDMSDVHYTDSEDEPASSICSPSSLDADWSQTSPSSRQGRRGLSEKEGSDERIRVEVIDLTSIDSD